MVFLSLGSQCNVNELFGLCCSRYVLLFMPHGGTCWLHNAPLSEMVSLLCVLQVPVDLVIDHSVQVDVSRTPNALQANMEMEFGRNKERFAFLKWGATAFKNMLVVPPGSGIVHQVSFFWLCVLAG